MNLLTSNKLDNIINIHLNMLSVKELLNLVNYPINEIYIDKFWDNIENGKWIYIDSEMLKYIVYSENIIKANKNYLNIISSNFEENIEYKSIFSKELQEDSKYLMKYIENTEINTHNKTKHLMVSSDCFKQSLMLLRTEKAKEIRKYYTELEKIYSNDNIVIEILNNNENHTYYVSLEDNLKQYNCNHCKYKTTVMGNLNRHYKGKKKCWKK